MNGPHDQWISWLRDMEAENPDLMHKNENVFGAMADFYEAIYEDEDSFSAWYLADRALIEMTHRKWDEQAIYDHFSKVAGELPEGAEPVTYDEFVTLLDVATEFPYHKRDPKLDWFDHYAQYLKLTNHDGVTMRLASLRAYMES